MAIRFIRWTGAALSLLAWLPLSAYAALLSGQVGKADIVMEFDDNDPAQVEGRYFYRQYHKDIALSGTVKNHQLTLYENVPYAEKPTSQPRLQLTKNRQGGWQGHWIGKDGKLIPVSLSNASIPGSTANEPAIFGELRRSSPYDLLRLTGLKLRQDKTDRFMGYAMQWQVEPSSGMRLFHITSGYPADSLKQINQVLDNRLWQSVNDFYQCMSYATRSAGYDHDQTVTPSFFNPQVVSVSVFTSYYCGGAHPDFSDNPINLDVATGKTLQLEDIFWLGKGTPPKDNDADKAAQEALQSYRETQLAPWLAKTFTQLYSKQFGDNDCDYSNAEYWTFPNWRLTEKGLYISPSYPRAARVCEYPDWPIVPYKLVNQHRGPTKIRLP